MLDRLAPELLRPTTAPGSALPLLDMAELTLSYLEQLGVDTVFGIPGGAIEPLYNAFARHQRRGGALRQVVARHESGAAFMADGYARERGGLGVCVATSGPGATNLITGVATAYANQIPLLVLTGEPALPSLGRHALQEAGGTGIDVTAMLAHCTRYSAFISHPDQFERKLVVALQHALRGTPGPVHLSVPLDIWRAPSGRDGPTHALAALLRPSALVDQQGVDAVHALLAASAGAVLLLGAGCAAAIELLLRYAVLKGLPFVVTPDAKGLVDAHHPLYRGVFGFAGHATAEATLCDPGVDLIVAVGASMGEWNTAGWSAALLNRRLVHIDSADAHLARTPMARLHLRGDIAATVVRLLALANTGAPGVDGAIERRRIARAAISPRFTPEQLIAAPEAFRSEAEPIKPQRLMRALSQLFPACTRYLADAGNALAWAGHYLQPPDWRSHGGFGGAGAPAPRASEGGWLRLTAHFAPMGWAIGAAVGTAAARPGAPVVCITGDGSMLMNGQELSTAVAERLCVIFVVLNDAAYGMVKHGQRLSGAEQIAYALPRTDFAQLARALGAQAFSIDSAAGLDALDIAAICRHPGPTLLDMTIDGEEVPPMAARLRVLAEGV